MSVPVSVHSSNTFLLLRFDYSYNSRSAIIDSKVVVSSCFCGTVYISSFNCTNFGFIYFGALLLGALYVSNCIFLMDQLLPTHDVLLCLL